MNSAVTPTDVPGQAIARQVLSAVFFCLMTVFVLNGIMAVVPSIVGDMLGDLNQSPILGNIGQRTGNSGGGLGDMAAKAVGAPFKKITGRIGK